MSIHVHLSLKRTISNDHLNPFFFVLCSIHIRFAFRFWLARVHGCLRYRVVCVACIIFCIIKPSLICFSLYCMLIVRCAYAILSFVIYTLTFHLNKHRDKCILNDDRNKREKKMMQKNIIICYFNRLSKSVFDIIPCILHKYINDKLAVGLIPTNIVLNGGSD